MPRIRFIDENGNTLRFHSITFLAIMAPTTTATRHAYILETARSQKLAGCTVLRGLEGYGRKRIVHTEISMDCAGERPVLIELVDEEDRLRNFLNSISKALERAFFTIQDILVLHYGSKNTKSGPTSQKVSAGKEVNMKKRSLHGAHKLLRIYFGQTDKVKHTPLYSEILKLARDMGLAGCTTLRGIAGFGASSVIHEDHILKLSTDLPIIVEITDTEEHIRKFLEHVSPLLQGTLVTEEDVTVLKYEHLLTGAS